MPAARRRSMAEFLQQQRELEEPAASGADALRPLPAAAPVVISASSVPDPHSPAGDGRLSPAEQADLATCEAALDNLRLAFAAAGKALQVIRDARLYRSTHDTFEAYVEQRWGMGKPQAYRLVEAWPLAERLSPIGERLTESHVRELLPFAGGTARTRPPLSTRWWQRPTASGSPRPYSTTWSASSRPTTSTRPKRPARSGPTWQATTPPPQPPPADPVQAFTSRVGQVRQGPAPLRTSGNAIRAAPTPTLRLSARPSRISGRCSTKSSATLSPTGSPGLVPTDKPRPGQGRLPPTATPAGHRSVRLSPPGGLSGRGGGGCPGGRPGVSGKPVRRLQVLEDLVDRDGGTRRHGLRGRAG